MIHTTLDNIQHYVDCIQQQNKGKKVELTPVLIDDVTQLSKEITGTTFFGILTVGNDHDYDILLMNSDNQTIIKVDPNTQIIEGFAYLFLKSTGREIRFRGYQVELK